MQQQSFTRETLAVSNEIVTVREAVFHLFRSFGADRIFGNPGSTELPMFRDFPDDFSYVLGLNECAVVAMADGYAQATGNAAIINLHSAVGVGHAMGSIFSAYRNATPLVITAGQQARSMLPFDPYLFSQQATELPKPYVKWSCEPARPEDVPQAIARAYYTAMQHPRGPALVSVPVDDWNATTTLIQPRKVSTRSRPEASYLQDVQTALNASQRPAFIVGTGIDRDGAWHAMVELAERHNALVWVAPATSRCSFPEDHPLFAGFLPRKREGIVTLLDGHDVLVVIGASVFTYHVEGHGPHIPPGASLFQLVDDPTSAAWNPVGSSMVCNIHAAVHDLLALPATSGRPRPAGRAPLERVGSKNDAISVNYLLQTLADTRPEDSIIVEEAPSDRPHIQDRLPIKHPSSFFTASSGGLGYSLPAAVGVAMAKPGHRIIALLGDGSSMYSIQALWSAADNNLPITIVIINNGGYSALKHHAANFGVKKPVGTELSGLDFVSLARGHGCDGIRVERASDLGAALTKAFESDRPTLVDVVIS